LSRTAGYQLTLSFLSEINAVVFYQSVTLPLKIA
jgi:hypothetical protein